MNNKKSWPIGEFISFELIENKEQREFVITLKGNLKYSDLISMKINDIVVTQEDIDRYVEK